MALVKVENTKGKIVEVDTDDVLSKADIIDLLTEVGERTLDEGDKEYLKDIIDEDRNEEPFVECNTLDDQMKRDYLLKVFDKYTLSQIEKALPE